jgi:ABC-type spermidine/putrescine transport system permease subunit II
MFGVGGRGAILAVSLIHAAAAIPWVVLLISAGMQSIDRDLEEQARLEGGLWHVFRGTMLPRLRLWLCASLIWCIVPIMTEMVVSNLYQVPTVAEQVYLDASRGSISPLTYFAAFVICLLPLAISRYDWIRMVRHAFGNHLL